MSEKHVKNVANITLLVCDKPHVEIYANRSISDKNSTQLSSDKCVCMSDGTKEVGTCVYVLCNLNLCELHNCGLSNCTLSLLPLTPFMMVNVDGWQIHPCAMAF